MNPEGSTTTRAKWGSMRPFVVAVVVFLLINLAVGDRFGSVSPVELLAHDSSAVPMQRTFPGWTAKAYVRQTEAPDMVLMGSSMVGSATFAADANTLQQALDFVKHRHGATLEKDLQQRLGGQVSVFNWSLGGAMVSDAYMISRALFNGKLKPKMVVIGVGPRDFMDNSLQAAGVTEPFRFFSRFVDTGRLTGLALPDFFARLDYEVNTRFPLRKLGMDWQCALAAKSEDGVSKKSQNQLLRAISATGDVSPGEWVIPANMPDIFQDNSKEYQRRFANPNPPGYAGQLEFFKEFLSYLKANDVDVLVVGMPTLWPNRKLLPDSFWTQWRSTVSSLCKENDVQWLDWTDSPNFVVADYLDTVHMNAKGGQKFFNLLADKIVSAPKYVAALQGKNQPRAVAGQRSDSPVR
jgi:hypothetical protein